MTSVMYWLRNTRMVLPIFALFAASLWFLSQEGCAQDREASLDPAISVALHVKKNDTISRRQDQAAPIYANNEKPSESIQTPSQSLKHASILLHRAATTLENNEVTAVQLIRQVISILKHQVIPSLLERNSVLVPISSLSDLSGQGQDGEEPIRRVSN